MGDNQWGQATLPKSSLSPLTFYAKGASGISLPPFLFTSSVFFCYAAKLISATTFSHGADRRLSAVRTMSPTRSSARTSW